MAGEPAAKFHDLYIRYSRDVYRFAFYLTGRADCAEDVTAETFLRIWSSPIPVAMPTVKSYLMTIARNLVIEEFRKRKWQAAEMPDQISFDDRLADRASARQELALVLARLAQLSEIERAALLLRVEHELSYDEIAAVLGIQPAAARVRVHRARTKLRGVQAPT